MKMYQVKKVGSEYGVYETKTEQYIRRYASYRAARRDAKSFASGRGFNGFTPGFIVNNTVENTRKTA